MKLPEPYTEVLVLIDGKRGPMWSNNYWLVAYVNQSGEWREERHPCAPLQAVIRWQELPPRDA